MNANPANMSPAAVIYQADPHVSHALKECREKLHHICRQHLHRQVQVQMDNGQIFTGVIAGFDDYYLYLDVSGSGNMRFPVYFPPYPGYSPYGASILPLVLFNLLTISLLY